MKRMLALALALVLGVFLLSAPAVLAYDSVKGCITDGHNNPWTHGATITCTRQGITVGSGSLDANGCFQVYIGNGPSTTCTFHYASGPNGTPADSTCSIPTNNSNPPQPYTQCNPSTGTGPDAVTLLESSADSAMPASTPTLAGLAILLAGIGCAGVVLVRRTAN